MRTRRQIDSASAADGGFGGADDRDEVSAGGTVELKIYLYAGVVHKKFIATLLDMTPHRVWKSHQALQRRTQPICNSHAGAG